MTQKSLMFLIKLVLILIVVFGIHIALLYSTQNPLFDNQIILSYFINYLLAVVVLFAVERSLTKNSTQSGFVFMAGSGLKFLIFFCLSTL